jgi:hypothetical protein
MTATASSAESAVAWTPSAGSPLWSFHTKTQRGREGALIAGSGCCHALVDWNRSSHAARGRLPLAEVGRTPWEFLTYSQLVDGVTFRLPTVEGGEPFEIDTRDWRSIDREIVSKFLGRMDSDSYRQGRFFASALVIAVSGNRPGPGFFDLAREVGLLRSHTRDDEDRFWFAQERAAREWYRAYP